ncbi:conserved hypothetical protein [Theileria orientalis strain Shintoku]|uniref:Uncharacterized protein n=1 Tax=Theileria orientalis strain Shintoku TaxID=869250 RepID=J4CD22_THEOR|nr:conserved hypothetical protein [Theileria orientalis strain Shintoku]BAM40387.1 conserved hypothetical protein [Theileria orientalis strain Shintoku]|eukprot:XP_009690688.1 conserved hypothetical protein [Theileria orientalis strain Shintoku]
MEDSGSIKVLIKDLGSEHYASKVGEEPLTDYPMFVKLTFREDSWLPFLNFSIIANGTTYNYNPEHRSLVYKNDLIFFVDIFVFRDNVNKPLLVGVNNGTNYYYFRISESEGHDTQLELDHPCNCSLTTFFDMLLDEHEKTNRTITFKIDNKTGYDGVDFTNETKYGFSTFKHVLKNDYKLHFIVALKGRNEIFDYETLESIQNKNFREMTAYYSNKSNTEIPLLIEFFNGSKRCYYHKENIHQKYWTEMDIKDENDLEKELNHLEAKLFYSILVSIDRKSDYIRGVIIDDIHSEGLNDPKNEQIKVDKNEKYSISNYVCYEHDLSVYNTINFGHKNFEYGDYFKSLFINISNITIEIAEEILDFILFVEPTPKLYVWFYEKLKKEDEQNLPLMIQYYNKTYIPKSRNEYFDKWVVLKSLSDSTQNEKMYFNTIIQKSESFNFMLKNFESNKFKHELDIVNVMLNEIDLNHKMVNTSMTSEYGIPRPAYLNTTYDTSRIHVEYNYYQDLFINCTHTTKNGFTIGKQYYTKQIYDQRSIREKNNPVRKHNKSKDQKGELNVNSRDVSIYYFKYDRDSEYPLMVEFKLYDSLHEYYVLRCNFFNKAEYELRKLPFCDKIKGNDLCTILTHQNFIIHNVISIKLDKRSSYACCDKKTHNKYLELVPIKIWGFECCRFKDEKNSKTTNFPFIHVAGYRTNSSHGYIPFKHNLTTFLTNKNMGTQDNKLEQIKIKGFQINNNDITLNGTGLDRRAVVKAPYVFVYFYGNDPRPLLVYFNNKVYVPEGLSNYPSVWNPVNSQKKFTIRSQQHINLLYQNILDKLNVTVGFLNTVNLYQHNKDDKNHTYDVHTYNNHHVKINVKPQNFSFSSTSFSTSCYKKLTHTPNGMNTKTGSDHDGFRLGNIEYNGNGLTGTLDYSNCFHKWHPLISVSVYYYKHDNDYKDPLLVELKFKVIMTDRLFDYYYKLKTSEGNQLKWEMDNNAKKFVNGGNDNLAKYLNGIRSQLKKILKIEINRQARYDLMLSEKAGKADTFQKENHYQIEVERCTDCPTLSNQDYKTFVHKISNINESFDYNSIGGIVFTLPGTDEKNIEISLEDSKTLNPIGIIHYDQCMGDVHVYFSKKSDSPAGVPILIRLNDQWYTPNKIENYYTKWSRVDKLEVLPGLYEFKDQSMIKKYFEEVNKTPNQENEFTVSSLKFPKPDSTEGNKISADDVKLYIDVAKNPSHNDMEVHYNHDSEIAPVNNMMPSVQIEIPSSDSKKQVDIETPNVDFDMYPADDLKIFSVNYPQIPPDNLEMTYVNNLEISPANDLEMPYSNEVQVPPIYDLKMPSIDDFETSPVNDPKIPYVRDLKIPYTHHLAAASIDLKQTHVDIERPDKSIKKPIVNIDMTPVNVFEVASFKDVNKSDVDTETPPDDDLEIFPVKYPQTTYLCDPELESLDDKFREALEDDSNIQGDQPKAFVGSKILDFTQDHNPGFRSREVSEKVLNPKNMNPKELSFDQPPNPLASTGLASTSADSDNSYLGPILGGTFGLLVTLGLFTFMLFKYFRRVRLRNMIPQLY